MRLPLALVTEDAGLVVVPISKQRFSISVKGAYV